MELKRKKDIGVPDLSPALQAALLAGDGRTHPGFSVPLGPTKHRNTVIDCVGLDELACMVTIAFNLKRLGPVAPGEENDMPPIVAHVSWGVDGARMDVDVDVVNGTMIAVPASSLRVDVELDMLAADVDDDTGEVQVGAVMGYMPRGQHDAQRTLSADLAAVAETPANVVLLPVPEFAKSVTFLVQPTATFQLEQLDDAAGTVVLSTIAAVAPAVPPTVVFPLANRTRYLRLTNAGAAALLVSAVFGLAL